MKIYLVRRDNVSFTSTSAILETVNKVAERIIQLGNTITNNLKEADALVIVRDLDDKYHSEPELHVSINQLDHIPRQCLLVMRDRNKMIFMGYIDKETHNIQFRMTSINGPTITALYPDIAAKTLNSRKFNEINQSWYI